MYFLEFLIYCATVTLANYAGGKSFSGDIPYVDPGASTHQTETTKSPTGISFGLTLNADKLDQIFSLLNFPSIESFSSKLSSMGALNGGVSGQKGEAATYLALSVAAKFMMMPPSLTKSETSAMRLYAILKKAGMDGDTQTVINTIKSNGGSTLGIPDDLVAYLWGTNEHQNLHCCYFGDQNNLANAVHATSLCDASRGEKYGQAYKDITLDIKAAGCNDGGSWPQAGGAWYESSKNYLNHLGLAVSSPASSSPSSGLSSSLSPSPSANTTNKNNTLSFSNAQKNFPLLATFVAMIMVA